MSHRAMLRAVLLDVGGTLWPDRLTVQAGDTACLEQLGRLLPQIDPAQALTVLRTRLRAGDGSLVQDTRRHRVGLRCVVASNVQVRGALEYGRDFSDLGIAHLVDAIVTSLEVGYRKPHPAFFEAAIRVAGCEPAACVMVGNSETNDIQPAVARGMRAVRVAIEEPPPASSAAHAVVTSLEAVACVVRRWASDQVGEAI